MPRQPTYTLYECGHCGAFDLAPEVLHSRRCSDEDVEMLVLIPEIDVLLAREPRVGHTDYRLRLPPPGA